MINSEEVTFSIFVPGHTLSMGQHRKWCNWTKPPHQPPLLPGDHWSFCGWCHKSHASRVWCQHATCRAVSACHQAPTYHSSSQEYSIMGSLELGRDNCSRHLCLSHKESTSTLMLLSRLSSISWLLSNVSFLNFKSRCQASKGHFVTVGCRDDLHTPNTRDTRARSRAGRQNNAASLRNDNCW